jgi:dipeptidyl aminopeptidase/acylaminoacyl peptidase
MIAVLVRAGIAVLAPNYRGTPGYGRDFGAEGNPETHAADIWDALAYAVNKYGIRSEDIGLFGHSYGAYLAARMALENGDRVGAAVLVSFLESTPLKPGLGGQALRFVVFHGENDIKTRPEVAKARLLSLFGGAGRRGPNFRFIVLPKDGHNPYRPKSWPRIYAELLALF